MLQWEHKFPASPLAVSGIREHLPGLAALIFKVAQEIWKAAKAGTPKSFDHEVYRGCGEPSWTGVWGWTDDFFSRDDPFLEWVDSAGLQRTAEHGDVLTGSKLWELFSNWCETNGYTRNGRQPFMSRKNFTQRVSALARSKTVNIRNGSSVVKGWRGLALSETSSYVDDSDFEVN